MHGALFIGYLYFAVEVMVAFKKNIGWRLKTFIAALYHWELLLQTRN